MSQLALTLDLAADQSGRQSRSGYYYQDLCALRYCIHAAKDGTWTEVWCESREDIVLVRIGPNGQLFRYVQVKVRLDADAHWTRAALCEVARRRSLADSIICKLFSKCHPRSPSEFRLATNEGVGADLRPFHYRWRHVEPTIDPNCKQFRQFAQRLAQWAPPAQTTSSDLLTRFAVEQHSADADDLEVSIRDELSMFLSAMGMDLLRNETETVFQLLHAVILRASTSDLRRRDRSERISAAEFKQLAADQANTVYDRTNELADTEPSTLLQAELAAIGVPQAMIDEAITLRRRFVIRSRRSMGTAMGKEIEAAIATVRAICLKESLRVAFEGMPEGWGLLKRVIERVEEVHKEDGWQARGLDLGLLHGICYYLLNKGTLRLAGNVGGGSRE